MHVEFEPAKGLLAAPGLSGEKPGLEIPRIDDQALTVLIVQTGDLGPGGKAVFGKMEGFAKGPVGIANTVFRVVERDKNRRYVLQRRHALQETADIRLLIMTEHSSPEIRPASLMAAYLADNYIGSCQNCDCEKGCIILDSKRENERRASYSRHVVVLY